MLRGVQEIKEGDLVKRTGRSFVPVGEELLGRVGNALAAIDGTGPARLDEVLPIERIGPGVVDRGQLERCRPA